MLWPYRTQIRDKQEPLKEPVDHRCPLCARREPLVRAFNTTAKSHVGTRDRAGSINAPRRKCVTRGCLLALGTEICTFKDTDQIASVLPSTDSH